MRRLVVFTCLLFCSQLAVAGQRSVFMRDFGEVPVSVIDDQELTLAQVKKDVIVGASRLGWQIQSSTDSEVMLRYEKTEYYLDIRVKFTNTAVSVEYVDSQGLNYEKQDNGRVFIHPSYNRWIGNLLKSISPLGQQQVLQKSVRTAPAAEHNMIVIHYRRNDMDYGGWGLHVWGDAFDGATSWFKPISLTRTDAFGAVYTVKPAAAPATSDAFFLVHRGDIKDKCSQDQSWDITQGREIFMVSGDCKIYFTVDEATKSRHFR